MNLWSGSWDKCIKEWNVSTQTCIRNIKTNGVVSCIQVVDNIITSSHRDHMLRTWDSRTSGAVPVTTFIGHRNPILCHYFNGHIIVSGGEDRLLKWWDVRTGRCIASKDSFSDVSSIFFDDSMLLAATWTGVVHMWSTKQQKFINSFPEHSASVDSLVVNGLNFITGSLDKSIKVWEIQRLPRNLLS